MRHRRLASAVTAACAVLIPAFLVVGLHGQPPGKKAAGSEVFDSSKVWALHLEIPAKEYEAMQPLGGMGGFGGPPQPPKDKKPGDRPSERNLFGTEFPWAQGEFTAEGQTCKKVGVRYAGEYVQRKAGKAAK